MADDIVLSPGGGGSTLRTLEATDGVLWPLAASVYATTLADGANVLQVVTPDHGLPVSLAAPAEVVQDTAANLLCTASQGGTWSSTVTQATAASLNATVVIAAAQTLANVTTVGTITNAVSVVNATAANLLTTASQGGSWTVAATQSGTWTNTVTQATAANLNATVVIAPSQTLATVTTVGAVTGITNPVSVVNATASSLLCTASIASGQTLAAVTTVGSVTSITNPVASTQSGTWTATVTQPTAANLNATVSIAPSQTLTKVATVDTITNPVAATQSGTWTTSIASGQTLATVTNVGTVGTITNAVTVAQPTASSLNATAVIAAGTSLIGKASVGTDSSTIYNGTTALTPKFAKIAASTSGQTSVVALVSGKKIRVLRFSVSSNAALNIKFQSASTDLTGLYYLTQFASAGGAYCPVGIFETAVGEALNINLSAAGACGGVLSYIEI